MASRFRAAINGIKSLQFRSARRLLHFWIRPTLLGCDAESLGLAEDDLVCFVMPFRSTADLLVVDRACEANGLPRPVAPLPDLDEARAFFFLGHPEGALGRRSLRRQSARMLRLLDHQAQLLDDAGKQHGEGANAEPVKVPSQASRLSNSIRQVKSIKIVPVSLFWGHQPDREASLFKLLFSENWSMTSGAKKFLAGLFHRHHILVQFSKPIPLDELMQTAPSRELQARKLLRLLRVHFNGLKRAILGPDLSHRRTLMSQLLQSPSVRQSLEHEARVTGKPLAKLERRARGYAKEICSDQSYRVIRFFDVLLTWLWNRLYDGVNLHGMERPKELAQSYGVIYTPCHRSHIDYLLLSYALYHNGLTPPHIASGKNLNLPVVGPLLRRAGAFFMRRSFKGDALYKAVFDEYLHLMFTRGHSVEYFIEGGRSRTGRTLNPRTGMISMTLRSFLRDPDRPLAFQPVYFGYERVLESTTYQAELEGSSKQTESIRDILKIFRTIRQPFGKVSVNFGQPVVLREFLDNAKPGWQDMSQQEFSQVCVTLAKHLAAGINAAATINASSLVALALLATPRQSMEAGHLKQHTELLRNLAGDCGPETLAITDQSVDEMLNTALGITGLTITQHQFGQLVSASPAQALSLTYSANSVVHVFMLVSLVARFVRVLWPCSLADVIDYCERLYPFVKAETFLHVDESVLPEAVQKAVASLARHGLIRQEGEQLLAPNYESEEYSSLQEISRISNPILERFYIALALLRQEAATGAASSITAPSDISSTSTAPTDKPQNNAATTGTATIGTVSNGMASTDAAAIGKSRGTRELEAAASGIAAQLSALYGINSPEFFDQSLFSTFLATMKQEGLLSHEGELTEGDGPANGLAQLEQTLATTIDPDVRQNINKMLGKL